MDTFIIISISSEGHDQLCDWLDYKANEAGNKKNLCIDCWAFITHYQKQYHETHEIATPGQFKDFENLKKLLYINQKWLRKGETYYRPLEELPAKDSKKVFPNIEKKVFSIN